MKNLLIILSLMIASTVLAQNQYGLSLDGGESFYLNDDSNNSLDLSSTWTLEAWIKVNSYNSSDFECIMDRRTVFSFYLIEDTDSPSGDYAIRFVTRDASDNLGRSLRSDTHTEKTMSLGQWHHVAVNYDGSTARLFVDETEVDSDTDSGWSLSASVKSLNIGGRYWGSYSRQLSGAIIDEVRISNNTRALSDQQTNNGDVPYTEDAHTIALFNFEDAGDPPTYATGTDNSGTVGDDDITSADYVDVSESLYLENRAPEIAAIADQTIDEHTAFTVAISTSDVNYDDLILHVLEVAGHAVISHTDT
ncbi:MAG: LamG domain-containing protein, partial [Candidatus Marinimicrobia bacterium]|nr:LamG domain-containing protein [Candidatus Neomarinimicrobiota bacterium]